MTTPPPVSLAAAAGEGGVGYVLQLFVAGHSELSVRAIERVRRLFDALMPGCYSLSVIDLYQQPELAVLAQVIAVPTLVRMSPTPVLHVIGDFSDRRQVCRLLGLGDDERT